MPGALIIGSSDGIGLALTELLLAKGWRVSGLSRSATPIDHEQFTGHIADVRDDAFPAAVRDAWAALEDSSTCIYCVGIGELLDPESMKPERAVFEVNLIGAVAVAQQLVPRMVRRGHGHFIALSSQADTFVDHNAPSYGASKAGLSSYLHGLALAVRKRGVAITNLRFGFVDTKMATSEVRPFMITREQAARRVWRCMNRRPIRDTYPKRMAALLWLLRWGPRVRIWLS